MSAPSGLARKSIGSASLWFFAVGASAPMTVLAGGVVATYAGTGVVGVPLSFLILAAALGLLTVGYVAMSRYVGHAATCYALLAHGLGRAWGVAGAAVALVAYNAIQICLYGLVGVTLAGLAGGPWWLWAGLVWLAIAVLGVLHVHLNARVLAWALVAEIAVIGLFDVGAFTHPAGGVISVAPLLPNRLVVNGVGGVFALGMAAFVGYESGPVFGEEARGEQTVGRATFAALGFLGLFYAVSSWALAVAVGPDQVVDAARDPNAGLPFSVLATTFGPLAAQAGLLLLISSICAAQLSFHNGVARYLFALGRERVLPASLARIGTGSRWRPYWRLPGAVIDGRGSDRPYRSNRRRSVRHLVYLAVGRRRGWRAAVVGRCFLGGAALFPAGWRHQREQLGASYRAHPWRGGRAGSAGYHRGQPGLAVGSAAGFEPDLDRAGRGRAGRSGRAGLGFGATPAPSGGLRRYWSRASPSAGGAGSPPGRRGGMRRVSGYLSPGGETLMAAHHSHPQAPRRHAGPSHSGRYEPPRRAAPFGSPPPAEPVSQPPVHDPVAADLRNQVVDRLRRMSVLHSRHAWERRYRDPLGPHALAFFYTGPPHGDPLRCTLRTATRLFLDGSDVEDLPRLLYDLVGLSNGYLAGGGFDPRAQMADRVERMPPRASYIGVGISTLDTPAGSWAQIRSSATSELEVPGRCFALLVDGTMLLLDRHGEQGFGAFDVLSTHSLDVMPGQPWRMWRWAYHLADLADPATRDIWHWLGQLHQLIAAGSHGR